jgi:hypothetical protein
MVHHTKTSRHQMKQKRGQRTTLIKNPLNINFFPRVPINKDRHSTPKHKSSSKSLVTQPHSQHRILKIKKTNPPNHMPFSKSTFKIKHSLSNFFPKVRRDYKFCVLIYGEVRIAIEHFIHPMTIVEIFYLYDVNP